MKTVFDLGVKPTLFAVPALLQHPDDPGDLSLDPAEPVHDRRDGAFFELHVNLGTIVLRRHALRHRMDYALFLLSAAREHYDTHADPHEAMDSAVRTSCRVIVAAGAAMVAVFMTFALSGPIAPKEMVVILSRASVAAPSILTTGLVELDRAEQNLDRDSSCDRPD